MNGDQVASQPRTGSITTSTNPLADRRRQPLRPVLQRHDRRSAHLQRRADRGADPGRHDGRESAVPSAPTDLTATAVSSTADRSQLGRVDATPLASPATASSAARAPAARTFTQIAAPTGTSYSDTGLTPRTTSYTLPGPRDRRRREARPVLEHRDRRSPGCSSRRDRRRSRPGRTQQFTASRPAAAPHRDLVGRRRRRRQLGRPGRSRAAVSTRAPSAPARTRSPRRRPTQSRVSATVYITDYAGMFTFHNDNCRTGQNLERDGAHARRTSTRPASASSSHVPLDGIAHARRCMSRTSRSRARASTTSSTSRPSTTASMRSTPTGDPARRSGTTASSTPAPASPRSRRTTPASAATSPPRSGSRARR